MIRSVFVLFALMLGSLNAKELVYVESETMLLSVKVNEETLIRFEESVLFRDNPSLYRSLFEHRNEEKAFYLTALKQMDGETLKFKGVESGKTYEFDLVTQVQSAPVYKMIGPINKNEQTKLAQAPHIKEYASVNPRGGRGESYVDDIVLARYAAQHTSIFQSAIEWNTPGFSSITKLSVPQYLNLNGFYRMNYLKVVEVVASYTAGRNVVTVLKVQNTTNEPIVIEPKNIRAKIKKVSFDRKVLAPLGHELSMGYLYVFTSEPFEKAVGI